MAESNERPAGERWIGFLPFAVFLVSSAFLLYWWQALNAAQGRSVEEHFRADSLRIVSKVSERLEAYDQILRGAAGLFAATDDPTRDQFRRYVEALQIGHAYRGIQGVGFAAWIPPERLEEHVRAVRAGGFPEYAVKPEGVRAGYTSVVYLEPFTGRNRRAFGLDGFAEPTRREAMERARDLGDVATSGKVKLVQETETDVQPGVLTFFPVYGRGRATITEAERRDALSGWVYTPLRMRDLMEGILQAEPRNIRLEIFDGPGLHPEVLLYDNFPGDAGAMLLSFTQSLQVNQRTWILRFTAGKPFLVANRQRPPAVDLAAMAFIALLLTGLSVALVASRRARVREIELSRSLRESEARWRITFERAPVGIFTVAPDGHFLTVNPRYCEITGFSEEELRGMTRDQIVHPDDRAADEEFAGRIRSGARPVGTLERRGLRKDGTVFWAEVTLSLETPRPGQLPNLVGVLDDVTARHEAETKFREIAERSLAAILVIQDDRVVYANPMAGEMLGVPAQATLGPATNLIEAVVHPEDLARLRADRELELNDPAKMPTSLSYRVIRADGQVRNVQRLVRSIQHQGRRATLLTVFDVTEREQMEEELRKSQRLESLGLVAGGIAHDFNNLLTAVFGHVEEARTQLAPEAPAARELDVALSALTRSRDLTRQLLTFATGGAPARKILPVARLVEDAVHLGLGGSSLRPHVELESGLPPVEADEGQMSQLLNNLLVNARQATPGAGDVTIRARSRQLTEGEVPPLPAGAYVQISIQDTGHGIPEHILPRVFDPFFTTRSTGTGLGLATSYSIARRHGGHISIASRVGEGSTVTLLLPAARKAAADRLTPPPAPAPAVARAGKLRVLLMDDEPLVLKVGVKHLRKMGHEVETAATGEEAVLAYRRRWSEGIGHDVVILDLTVPGGMGGAEALEQLREIDPGVVAIACSGYFEDGIMADPGKFGFAGVLGKPYLTADMERVLEAAAPRER
jgi:two-component system cell cycle sensor histidine kinase/response regulator CckA